MIEEVRRAGRQNKTLDDAYFSNLYTEITALYRLDQVKSTDFGPLPETAVWLLAALGGTWVILGAVLIAEKMKKKR